MGEVTQALALLTDRDWNARWVSIELRETVKVGESISVEEQWWDVLNHWYDLDNVHLVFCVLNPEAAQPRFPGTASETP